MTSKAAVTVLRSPDEVRQLWQSSAQASRLNDLNVSVTFEPAPGDRGTELHAELQGGTPAKFPRLVRKLAGAPRIAKVKDELRHFKQQVETGAIPRSDASPEGERAERKFKQRPARPLEESELQKVGA
jgi:uncharacterized membrane protein